jgi:choline dehydrogenase-like flavoprotein
LLESGGLEFDAATQRLADGETVGLPYYPLHETRIRVLGGSTLSWGGVCTPLDDIALEERPWVPDATWPFPARTLDPYLDGAFEMCGVTPEARERSQRDVADRAREWGIDASRMMLVPLNFSRPTRFGREYRDRLGAAPNIAVYLHSTAVELELSQSGTRIEGISVATLTGRRFRCTARQYVLAAGGVETPRLMLASNRRDARGVGNSSGAVGRFFMEHPRVVNRYRIRPGNTPLALLVGGGAPGRSRFLRLAPAPEVQRREQLLGFHANLQFGYACQLTPEWQAIRRMLISVTPPWNESPYYQDAGGGPLRMRARDVAMALRRPDRAAISCIGAVTQWPFLRRFLEVHSAVEQLPDATNRVELLPALDALGVPRVRVTWGVGEQEERTYRRALAMLLDELDRLEPGIAAASIAEQDPWPAQLTGTWHHIGSTRMHREPGRGVVDSDCRVHGIDNLFVTGSSVFPASGSAAPTLTIIQLSLRLADHLSVRLG